MNKYLTMLAETKEKILFGMVLLLTLLICVYQVQFSSGSLEDVRQKAYDKAIDKVEIAPEAAAEALKQLKENKPPAIEPLKPGLIERPFMDDRSVFDPGRLGSGWMIQQGTNRRLPPLQLDFPGFPRLTDFDIPAGPAPDLRLVRGSVPRDTREVTLTRIEGSEFGNDE